MDEDLKLYFDQQFSSMREHLEATMDRRFGVMEQRFDGKIEQLRQEMNQRFDVVEADVRQVQGDLKEVRSDVRQAYVLIENIHGQVRLVADGVANCNEQLQRHREEVSERLADQEELDLRVRRLESDAGLPPTGSLRRSRSR